MFTFLVNFIFMLCHSRALALSSSLRLLLLVRLCPLRARAEALQSLSHLLLQMAGLQGFGGAWGGGGGAGSICA